MAFWAPLVAGAMSAVPAWLAVIVHVPAPMKATVALVEPLVTALSPVTVQTPAVPAQAIRKPAAVVDAETWTAALPKVRGVVGCANVIVCGTLASEKALLSTGVRPVAVKRSL